MEVLRRVMIRSSKAGVTESRLLPKCTKATVRLPFDPVHQESYNSLVEVPPPLLPPIPFQVPWCPMPHSTIPTKLISQNSPPWFCAVRLRPTSATPALLCTFNWSQNT